MSFMVAGARNHLQANTALEFRFEIRVSATITFSLTSSYG